MIFLPCIIFPFLLGQVLNWPAWAMADLAAALTCLTAYLLTGKGGVMRILGGAAAFLIGAIVLESMAARMGENGTLIRAIGSPAVHFIIAFVLICYSTVIGVLSPKV